jgi:molecular chaperone HtpG
VRIREADGTWQTVSRTAVFVDREADDPEVRALGAEWLGSEPLDVIPLDVPGTGTRGVAYVLPFTPSPGARQTHRVYLGRMLMGEHVGELLPEWAFFVRCVLDTTGLTPTASREQLIDDASLEFTREELSAALRRWILKIAATEPHRFHRFLSVHQLALKAVAVHDDELASALLPALTFETSQGVATIERIAASGGPVRYAETNDEFRQIAPIADAESPIVNGGYTYDAELLRRIPVLLGVPVQRVTVSEVLDDLAPPPLDERVLSSRLEQRATLALQQAGVEVSTRSFAPTDLPGLSVVDPEVIRRIERQRAAESTTPVWSRVLGGVDALLEQRRERAAAPPSARLCLNWANPLVRRLATLDDPVVFDRTVRLLHVQSLLAAHRPLGPSDRAMLTTALDDIVQLSVLGSYPDLTASAEDSADPQGDPA